MFLAAWSAGELNLPGAKLELMIASVRVREFSGASRPRTLQKACGRVLIHGRRRDDDSDDGRKRNARRSKRAKNGKKKADDEILSMAVISSSDRTGSALTAPAAAAEAEDEDEDDEGHE